MAYRRSVLGALTPARLFFRLKGRRLRPDDRGGTQPPGRSTPRTLRCRPASSHRRCSRPPAPSCPSRYCANTAKTRCPPMSSPGCSTPPPGPAPSTTTLTHWSGWSANCSPTPGTSSARSPSRNRAAAAVSARRRLTPARRVAPSLQRHRTDRDAVPHTTNRRRVALRRQGPTGRSRTACRTAQVPGTCRPRTAGSRCPGKTSGRARRRGRARVGEGQRAHRHEKAAGV